MNYLDDLEILKINKHGKIYFGSDQEWYNKHIQRYSGCGPTVCANALLYLNRPDGASNKITDGTDWKDILELMEYMWEYVTPGKLGVNSTAMLKEGLVRFAEAESIDLKIHNLDVSQNKNKRPDFIELSNFLKDAFADGCPVAFLNLSNGDVYNLESWHWVLAIGLDGEMLTIYDQGEKKEIDLKKWLETTLLGGGFVSIGVS